MSELYIIDELEGDEPKAYDLREIGEQWRSEFHVLVVLAGEGDGLEYGVMHPAGCDHECAVAYELAEGGFEQPGGYEPVPTEPGLYPVRLVCQKGGWITGSYAVEHDAWLTFTDVIATEATA